MSFKKSIGLKFFLPLILLFFLSSCAGTGSKTKPIVSSNNSGNTNLFFARQGGFIASAVLAKIEVNGIEIGKLGINEFTKFQVSKDFKIKVSGSGVGGFGMGTDSTSGIANGENNFYIIGVKQGLFSTKFFINETTETGYNQVKWF